MSGGVRVSVVELHLHGQRVRVALLCLKMFQSIPYSANHSIIQRAEEVMTHQ